MMKEYPFASELRLRRLKNLTLRELGEAIGDYSTSYLSDIEHGRRLPPDRHLVARIEKSLGVPVGSLEACRTADKAVRALSAFTNEDLRNELIRRSDTKTQIVYAVVLSNYYPRELDSLFSNPEEAAKQAASMDGDWRVKPMIVFNTVDEMKAEGEAL